MEATEARISQLGGTVFAVDSVGHPVAVEFAIGEGRICFVPLPKEAWIIDTCVKITDRLLYIEAVKIRD